MALLYLPSPLIYSRGMKQIRTYYQTGSIASLLSGCYDGDRTIADIMQHGDFGLGTINAVDGELVIDQGQCYHCSANGTAQLADPNTLSPFCVVTTFSATQCVRLNTFSNMNELFAQFDNHIGSRRNQMHALRIEAQFDRIQARSECAQPKPYRPLAETLPKLQTQLEWHNISGVLVITYFPDFMESINARGYHVHFISRERSVGGHVFDCQLNQQSNVEICHVDRLTMDSINNKLYNSSTITPASKASSDAVEKND